MLSIAFTQIVQRVILEHFTSGNYRMKCLLNISERGKRADTYVIIDSLFFRILIQGSVKG